MSTKSEPHIGMGVQHYGWFTSPLRRAADYINQKQLISLIDDTAEPLYQNSDAELFAALRDFDAAYTAYADFQRQMEAYWSLVYLQQQGTSELTATILKEDLVRIEGLPLVTRATSIRLTRCLNRRHCSKSLNWMPRSSSSRSTIRKPFYRADNVI